jgi:hypothetical protein
MQQGWRSGIGNQLMKLKQIGKNQNDGNQVKVRKNAQPVRRGGKRQLHELLIGFSNA